MAERQKSKQIQNIMKKLESLKSLKFKEMTTNEMATFRGGVIQSTSTRSSPDGGKTWQACADRYDTVLKCTEYLIHGTWV
ncbi:hypothetical protein CLU96_3230 [Chryseobacterium sp. 52]|nr:hypothetical protein CLU96_3230 [Chryseobacterium sp. 52]